MSQSINQSWAEIHQALLSHFSLPAEFLIGKGLIKDRQSRVLKLGISTLCAKKIFDRVVCVVTLLWGRYWNWGLCLCWSVKLQVLNLQPKRQNPFFIVVIYREAACFIRAPFIWVNDRQEVSNYTYLSYGFGTSNHFTLNHLTDLRQASKLDEFVTIQYSVVINNHTILIRNTTHIYNGSWAKCDMPLFRGQAATLRGHKQDNSWK
jgi:hypothetical protein